MRFFLDFKSGGALCTIFATMYRFKAEQRWRKFDFTGSKVIFIIAMNSKQIILINVIFQNQSKKDKDPILQMFLEIESCLIDGEFWRSPVVYVRPEIVDKALVAKMTEIITSHQGEITEDEEEATHIVHPTLDPTNDEYARPVFKREKHLLLHWYYFPDSYDSWIPNIIDTPDNVPDCPASPGDRWNVSSNWVTDLSQYNEWMNEVDYEVDAQGRRKAHKFRMGVDDVSLSNSDDKGKKQMAVKAKRKRSPSPQPKGGKRKR